MQSNDLIDLWYAKEINFFYTIYLQNAYLLYDHELTTA